MFLKTSGKKTSLCVFSRWKAYWRCDLMRFGELQYVQNGKKKQKHMELFLRKSKKYQKITKISSIWFQSLQYLINPSASQTHRKLSNYCSPVACLCGSSKTTNKHHFGFLEHKQKTSNMCVAEKLHSKGKEHTSATRYERINLLYIFSRSKN